MASTRRKSAAIALAVIGVAGLSLAAAAQLTVNSSTLGAGTAIVAACDTDGIAVDYTVLGANVTEVVLTGVAATCADDDYSVTLTDTSGAVLQAVSGADLTLVGTTATIALAALPVVPVASVTGVSIVIH